MVVGPMVKIQVWGEDEPAGEVNKGSHDEEKREDVGVITTLINFRRKVDGDAWDEGASVKGDGNDGRRRTRKMGMFEVEEHWCHDPMPYHMALEVLQEGRKENGRVEARVGFWKSWISEEIVTEVVAEVGRWVWGRS